MEIKHRDVLPELVVQRAYGPHVVSEPGSLDGEVNIVKQGSEFPASSIALLDKAGELQAEILVRAEMPERHHGRQLPDGAKTKRLRPRRLPSKNVTHDPHKEGGDCSNTSQGNKDKEQQRWFLSG